MASIGPCTTRLCSMHLCIMVFTSLIQPNCQRTHPIINRQCSWVKRLLWYAILVTFHFPSGFSINRKKKKIKNICVPSLFWQAMQIICAVGRNIFIKMMASGIWNLRSGLWKSCSRRELGQQSVVFHLNSTKRKRQSLPMNTANSL